MLTLTKFNFEEQAASFMEPTSISWKLTSDKASFQCNGLSGLVSLKDPSLGMALSYDDDPIEGSLWSSSDLHGEKVLPEEVYVRGDDLVISMPATKSFPCETVWYWSITPLLQLGKPTGAMIRLTLSIQTDLLDTSPVVPIASSLFGGASESNLLANQVRCLTAKPGVWSCFEIAHPSDQSECVANRLGETEMLSITLPFLEKGVIRRARVAAIFMPEGAGPNCLEQAVSEFVKEPLPLTT